MCILIRLSSVLTLVIQPLNGAYKTTSQINNFLIGKSAIKIKKANYYCI